MKATLPSSALSALWAGSRPSNTQGPAGDLVATAHSTSVHRWSMGIGLVFLALMTLSGCDNYSPDHESAISSPPSADSDGEPLRVLVMDPLAEPFACTCVPPQSWHRYGPLEQELQMRLGRSITLTYGEALDGPDSDQSAPDLIIGKTSWVRHLAESKGLSIASMAMLTDVRGETSLRGVFLVRDEDPAQAIEDLQFHRLLLGPEGMDEKHAAALDALKSHGVIPQPPIYTSPRCTSAALAVFEGRADAAVISDYAVAMLDSGKFFPPGALRVIGRTEPVAFIGVFGTPSLTPNARNAVRTALCSQSMARAISAALHSQAGFTCTNP